MLLVGAHWLLVKLLLCGVCVEYGMKVPLGIQRLPLSPMVPWAGRGGRFFSYLGRSHSWISLSSECNAASQVFRGWSMQFGGSAALQRRADQLLGLRPHKVERTSDGPETRRL